MRVKTTILITSLLVFAAIGHMASAREEKPWPAPVANFQAPEAGEHPRLLFRERDLPRLRALAQTGEGQAILRRLRACLNGADGESLPTQFNPVVGPAAADGSGAFHKTAPLGAYTFSHIVGYGFLYQLTGEQKYADLGWQCFEKALAGYRDRDRRYAFHAPYGALRAGPVMGWTAVGFDLCYDGWTEEQRKTACLAMARYDEGKKKSLQDLVKGSMPPFSNHFGMQVGGAALALLAIEGEPWVDAKRIASLLRESEKSMIRNLTEGFGDGGFFAEGDGTGSMSSHIVFLTALQAWKTAAGKDFISPRPNAPWTALKWIFLTIPRNGKMDFWPKRGAYPHNVWDRDDKSGSGYFALGFGGVTQEQKPALLWFYNHYLKKMDARNGTPFDTPSPYPHFAVCSLINWPWGVEERNPAAVIPLCYRDTKWSFYAFRNRWRDENDIVISVLTKNARGYHKANTDGKLKIAACGQKESWGKLRGDVVYWRPGRDGSALMAMEDGTALAVDFTKASGADAMLVMTGPGAGKGHAVSLNGRDYLFKFIPAEKTPSIHVQGGQIKVGKQTITFNEGHLNLGTMR